MPSIIVAHQGFAQSGQLWYTSKSDRDDQWAADQRIPNVGMSGSPAAAVLNNRLYLFHQGSAQNGQLWYTSSSDGDKWDTDQQIPNVGMSVGPAAVGVSLLRSAGHQSG